MFSLLIREQVRINAATIHVVDKDNLTQLSCKTSFLITMEYLGDIPIKSKVEAVRYPK